MRYSAFHCKITHSSSRLYFTVNAQETWCPQSPCSMKTVLPRFQCGRSPFTIPKTSALIPCSLPTEHRPWRTPFTYVRPFTSTRSVFHSQTPLVIPLGWKLSNSTELRFSLLWFAIVLQRSPQNTQRSSQRTHIFGIICKVLFPSNTVASTARPTLTMSSHKQCCGEPDPFIFTRLLPCFLLPKYYSI